MLSIGYTFSPGRFFVLAVWLLLGSSLAASAAEPSFAIPKPSSEHENLARRLAASLDQRANLQTGLSLSYMGDESIVARNGAQIYDTGLRLLAGSRFSAQIIQTFARNNAAAANPEMPQTLAGQFSPANGIYSWIRIEGFDQPGWWNNWEWSVKTGENAWLGKGALHFFRASHDPLALKFAKERAEFILALQDEDGGIRIGPRGLADDFWWQRKSTENNESALSFLDDLARTTGEKRYQKAADRIYAWLVTIYDRKNHVFRRGEVEKDGQWRKDGVGDFAADTTSWVPIERILQDVHFGTDRRERLAEIGKMMAATLEFTGVMSGNNLAGISYSPRSKKAGVISLEWSSQYALLCLRLAKEYHRDGDMAKAGIYYRQYADLVQRLLGYLKEKNGERLAAHAVYADGRVAAGEPMWDEVALTPRAFLSAASHLYIGFALKGLDPLRLVD